MVVIRQESAGNRVTIVPREKHAIMSNPDESEWPDTDTWGKMKPSERFVVLKKMTWPESEAVLAMLEPAEKNVVLSRMRLAERQAILDNMRPSESDPIIGSSKPLWVRDPYRTWPEWGCMCLFVAPLMLIALFGVGLLLMHPVGWCFLIGLLIFWWRGS